MTDLVLLAVTRMLSGVCIGGVAPDGGPWVRPVKAFGCPQLGDIRYADGTLMQPFDVVALSLLELFVAFLQAYVFVFLTSLFMGMALHPEH